MKMRRILIVTAVIGVLGFIGFFYEDILRSFRLMRDVSLGILALMIPLIVLRFITLAQFFRSSLRAIGARSVPSLLRMITVSIASNFANMVIPSAGAAGISLMAATLKRDQVTSGQTTFVQLARYGIVYSSFVVLLIAALLLLYFSDEINQIAIRIVLLLIANIIVVSGVGVYMLYDKRGFNWLARKLQQLIDWVARKFRHGKNLVGRKNVDQLLREFHHGLHELVAKRSYLKKPLAWGLFNNVVEVLILYIIFLALGFAINPGVVIIAFAVASGAGIVTVIPGDVGVYEFAMITTLSVVGVPLAVGLSATLLYRILTKLIMLPFGFYFYNKYVGEVTHGA